MQDKILHINNSLIKANEEKSVACKSDSDLDFFKTASKSYNELAKFIQEIINTNEISASLHFQLTITIEFSLFESNECFYGFLFRKKQYDDALKIAEQANKHIENLLSLVESGYETVDVIAKNYIDRGKIDWKLSSLTIKIKLLEPIARKSMEEKDFVKALDYYNKINDLHEVIHNYIITNEVDLVLKRTELGNYYSAKAGTANSLSAIFVMKSGFEDYFIEILEQFLFVLKYLKLALLNNPEQDKFKIGINSVTDNIRVLLSENKKKWFEYIIYFKHNKNLELIMRQTDNDNYKMSSAKLELEKDKTKRFILTFGYLISLFLILTYVFFQIAISQILLYRFLVLIFVLPLLFTIIGAFALRSTESLKEENFLKLMKLAFKINIKGLKIFSSKEK